VIPGAPPPPRPSPGDFFLGLLVGLVVGVLLLLVLL
jgi:hypothetical protein